ncbi:hypothetical protein BGZ93_002749 [Podila epicladia]|nr:hypothetical protein BGZ93_002749 [Podila epicladia]
MTSIYQAALTTPKAQAHETLVAWRTKTIKPDRKRVRDELGLNFTEQFLLSDEDLDIIEERFADTINCSKDKCDCSKKPLWYSGNQRTSDEDSSSLETQDIQIGYPTQNNIFNVDAVIPNSVIKELADQRAKIKTASMIPSIVQWKPRQQRYLHEIYEMLC